MAILPSPLRRLLQPFLSRPNLMGGAAAGLAFYLLASHWLARDITRALVGWDLGVVVFAVLCFFTLGDDVYEQVIESAPARDEGRHVVLSLALMAATASIVAIAAELSQAKSRAQVFEAFSVALTVATIALSWFFVHLVFALHYAHEYGMWETEAGEAEHKPALDFPNDDKPDYWDFLYFAVVIGATAQTADVNIHAKKIRRIATAHGLISFAFNTAILATMINLASGLFSTT